MADSQNVQRFRRASAISRLIKDRGLAVAPEVQHAPGDQAGSWAPAWRSRFASAWYSSIRAGLCGTSRGAVVAECGHRSPFLRTCGLARLCPDCADREARRQFAVTLARWEAWLEPGARPWFVTLTSPWSPTDEADARNQLRALRRAWGAWFKALQAGRGDLVHWDAWAQLGEGLRWHVHAIVWSTGADCGARDWPIEGCLVRFAGSPTPGRPWLAPFLAGSALWMDATRSAGARYGLSSGWVWRADACREKKGGDLLTYAGGAADPAARRAAAYSARYAGRPWAADTPDAVVAMLATGLRYLHSTWRDRQPARPARAPVACPGCGRLQSWDATAEGGCFCQAVSTPRDDEAQARALARFGTDELSHLACEGSSGPEDCDGAGPACHARGGILERALVAPAGLV